jgi:hypothetical protein
MKGDWVSPEACAIWEKVSLHAGYQQGSSYQLCHEVWTSTVFDLMMKDYYTKKQKFSLQKILMLVKMFSVFRLRGMEHQNSKSD